MIKPYLNLIKEKIIIKGLHLRNFIIHQLKFKNLKNKIVLDIGCGNGQFTYALAPHVKSIIGIDPSMYMLESARNARKIFNYKNIRFYNGSAEDIPFTNKRFDIILFSNSLHFCDNLEIVLNNAFIFLEKNGIIFISEPGIKPHFGDKILNPTSDIFNKKLYNEKQKTLTNTRDSLFKFIKKNKLNVLYKVLNETVFRVILIK
jgi:ubiquinone/menaquinone biosynthesis C-methylase UbiE